MPFTALQAHSSAAKSLQVARPAVFPIEQMPKEKWDRYEAMLKPFIESEE